jgi:hypothetical protein
MMMFTILMALVVGIASASDDVQWVRVTALLEPGSGATVRAEQTMVPGGVYSLAEVDRRGMDAIDREILERTEFLSGQMREVEEAMRLATLLARQYYLPLEVGEPSVLPAVDLNPRLGIVITPLRFVGDRAVCRVQFLEPEGPSGTSEFSGEPITLQLKDASLQDLLRTFSKLTTYSVEIDPSIDRKVTVDLHDVPWDQALDLILRINSLGWTRDGDTLWVAPLDEISRRKRVRTEATISLPRDSWGSATIASRGDAENPTVVLVVESVDGQPDLAAERDGLVIPRRAVFPSSSHTIAEGSAGEMAVFRAGVTQTGELHDVEVLAAPSQGYSEQLREALESWQLRTVLDEEGRKREAVAGYGIRLVPQRVLASVGAVEHIGVEIKSNPVAEQDGLYVISAVVTDLDTGKVVSAPRVNAKEGTEANLRTGFVAPSGEPTNLEMSFLISEDGKVIRYSWILTRDGEVVSSHRAEFGL